MSDEATWPPQRRADDTRIARLEGRMDSFEKMLSENTTTTKEVRDILGSFKMLGTIAKWVTTVAAAAGVAYHAVQSFFHK